MYAYKINLQWLPVDGIGGKDGLQGTRGNFGG